MVKQNITLTMVYEVKIDKVSSRVQTSEKGINLLKVLSARDPLSPRMSVDEQRHKASMKVQLP